MNYREKIKKLLEENNGIVTNEMVISENIPNVYLSRMVKDGVISKVDRGIYSDSEVVIDEYYLLYQKNQRIIFSFSSALFLHNLTDRIPYEMEVTLPNTYNSSHIEKPIIIHKVIMKYYDVGKIMIKTMFGNEVASYDMERTICDLVRFRKNIDVEVFSKAIKNYSNSENRDYKKLRKYAEVFRISKQINDILDVI